MLLLQFVFQRFLFVISLLLLFNNYNRNNVFVTGTITVIDDNDSKSGPKFASRQTVHKDHIGKELWNGYKYMGRLQYITDNIALCPTSTNVKYTIIPSKDGMPIALIVRGDTDTGDNSCTLQEKIKFIVNNIEPKGYIRYILMDSSTTATSLSSSSPSSSTSSSSSLRSNVAKQQHLEEEGAGMESVIALTRRQLQEMEMQQHLIESYHTTTNNTNSISNIWRERQEDVDTACNSYDNNCEEPKQQNLRQQQRDAVVPKLDWFNTSYDKNSNSHIIDSYNMDDNDIQLYIIHISAHTAYKLIDIVRKQSLDTYNAGGTRITIDTQYGTGGIFTNETFIWFLLSAFISACACSFLLLVNSSPQEDENISLLGAEHPPQQRRPTRRRLTRDQVRDTLPIYRYDGTTLHRMKTPPSSSTDHTTTTASQHEAVVEERLGGTTIEGSLEGSVPGDNNNSAPRIGRNRHRSHHNVPVLLDEEDDNHNDVAVLAGVDLTVCSICLDEFEMGDKVRVLPNCNHPFHSKCIGRWLSERSSTCPLCKDDLYDEDAVVPEANTGSSEPNTGATNYIGDQQQQVIITDEPWWDRLYSILWTGDVHNDNNTTALLSAPLLQQQDTEEQNVVTVAATRIDVENNLPVAAATATEVGSTDTTAARNTSSSLWGRFVTNVLHRQPGRQRIGGGRRQQRYNNGDDDSDNVAAVETTVVSMLTEPLLLSSSEPQQIGEQEQEHPTNDDDNAETTRVLI